jgi:hypothetical protein
VFFLIGVAPYIPPIRGTEGNCPIAPEGTLCDIEHLRPFFAEFGEQRLRQMSAICWSESHGDPNRARDACLRTGENCNGNYRKPNCVTNEYSVGIFQINLINENCPYLKNQYSTRTTGQPACIITDAAKFQTECVNPKIEFNYNVNRAVQKLRSQGIGAWPATAKKCGYK